MTELVPFQEKRKKMFPENTPALHAVVAELQKHFQKYYPTLTFGTDVITRDDTLKTIGNLQLPTDFDFTSFAEGIAAVTSPALLNESATFTLARLELPQLLLSTLANKTNTRKPFEILPKPYQKMLKRIYLKKSTLESLATFLESKKRARKYLRILHKRLGIYTKKKPPFAS